MATDLAQRVPPRKFGSAAGAGSNKAPQGPGHVVSAGLRLAGGSGRPRRCELWRRCAHPESVQRVTSLGSQAAGAKFGFPQIPAGTGGNRGLPELGAMEGAAPWSAKRCCNEPCSASERTITTHR